MVTTVSPRRTAAAILFVAPIAVLSACSPNEPIASQPGTNPPVWTGSPAPAAAGEGTHGAGHGEDTHAAPQASASSADTLTAQIKAPDGTQVAAATFEFQDGFATVTVQTTGTGKLAPGFHGLHLHSFAKCEPNSVAPTGGAPGDFLSAGGHFQAGGHSGHPASGDLASLQVREDGSAMLVTTTNAFTKQDLLGGNGTAIIIHADADNFANIPPERYQQIQGGAPGPDEATMATGDAGKRVACGVVGTG
ncbi:superoxide dismutase[Cu-Zn] [Mycolicibacterium rhodesiae]|uniref:Superoxide dismutase [Cu-Zn] n=1 Tax=Mycolicibacterium rhodesiae TaxID=36814 RepID=A0A1X0J1A6_MYCRH|nr:superoxide dismutase family protein [Mycolicibacterium rhodesiae]MCV7345146.1 superoxide dismutase family protein [Mycolicibacterium rhodesiae]ORB54785.1 superoxide dismutase [Mycolicibacterium rhodesiae]